MVVFNRDGIVKLTDAQIHKRMRDYRQDIHVCEISAYLGIKATEPTATHHIRGGNVRRLLEANEPCNYLAISDAAHTWGHAHPSVFEVICWYAKWDKESMKLPMDEYGSPLDWSPKTIDVLCGAGGLKGRIEGLLIPKIKEFGGEWTNKALDWAGMLLKALGE